MQAVEAQGREREVVEDSAVALGDVEVPVGPEQEVSAVVPVGRVRDEEDLPSAPRIGHVRIGRAPVLLDHGPVLAVGVVDVEEAGAVVVRREGDRQQPFLEAGARDAARHVQEGPRQRTPVLDDPDPPLPLDDEQPRIARGCGHVHGLLEAADLDERDLRRRLGVVGRVA